MSNPTSSILSRRRLRLTKTRCSRAMSRGRGAALGASLGASAPVTSWGVGFWEGTEAASLAVVTTLFYHRGAQSARPAIESSIVRFALSQINPTIGDFDGNRRLVWEATLEAERRGADLAIFPELALSGYPPKDLLERPAFLDAALASLAALAADLAAAELRVAVLVGFPERLPPSSSGRGVANSAALVEDGHVTSV